MTHAVYASCVTTYMHAGRVHAHKVYKVDLVRSVY